MARHVSPATIGAFVVGSFALLIAAVVVVGAGNLLRKPQRFICLFRGDLNGLKVGAPVKVRGVQIGSVEQIMLVLQPSDGQLRPEVKGLRLPVIVDLDESLVKSYGGSGAVFGQAGFDSMIARGLRAQLNVESLLTGLLYIDLDIHDTPPDFAIVPGSGLFREIPTVPTQFEKIQEQATTALARFDKIDFEALARSITKAAESVQGLASSPNVKATIDELKETTENLNKAVTSVRATVENANSKIDPLVASFRKSADNANATMKDTQAALVDLRSILDPDSPLAVNLNEALDQFAQTTRSVDELTNYLQRNPAALIRGKYVPEKDR
jgi:paraquat-inducible protein B